MAQLSPEMMRNSLVVFWQKIEQLADMIALDIGQFSADHVAMRINEIDVAKQVHQAWLAQGQQLSQAEINGRPIIVLKLDEGLRVANQVIPCIELPYPSAKTYPQQGWEHVEFVLASDAQSIDAFVQDIRQQCPQLAKKWSQLPALGVKVKLSSPQGEGERLANPTVTFKSNGVCIKLHPHSLEQVIASEQN